MKFRRGGGARALGFSLFVFFLAFSVGLSLLLLVAIPLVRWAIHGVLYFSFGKLELIGLVTLIAGMTFVTTGVVWLLGRRKGQW
jgi:hypothetical protein